VDKQQLLKNILAAIDISTFAYVEVKACRDRYWRTLACDDKASAAVHDLFKKRLFFQNAFELRVKDLEARPHKTTANLYWPGADRTDS